MIEKQMKRGTIAVTGIALAACAACCAPLVTPLLAWLGLSGLGMATTGRYLEIAVVSALVLGGFLLFRRRKAECRVDEPCGCRSRSKP